MGKSSCFVFCAASDRIKALVFYLLKVRKCDIMALKCELCGKGPQFGNVVSHANNTRRRRWNPNLKRVRAVVNGARKQLRVCTACIRLGRVKKAA
jgi:large subunit ribosomal protein L28